MVQTNKPFFFTFSIDFSFYTYILYCTTVSSVLTPFNCASLRRSKDVQHSPVTSCMVI